MPPANANVGVANPPREGIATRIGSYSGSTSRDASFSTDKNYSLDDDSVAIVKDLQSKLENRLSVRENLLWSFRLGKVLGKLKAGLDSDEKTQMSVSEINQLGANVPSGIPESATARIKEIVEVSRQATPKAEIKEKLTILIEELRNLKTY